MVFENRQEDEETKEGNSKTESKINPRDRIPEDEERRNDESLRNCEERDNIANQWNEYERD